jgi:hypothetical protein
MTVDFPNPAEAGDEEGPSGGVGDALHQRVDGFLVAEERDRFVVVDQRLVDVTEPRLERHPDVGRVRDP